MPWFSFTDASGGSFVFRLTEADRVAEARAILSGAVSDAVHVGGIVVKAPIAANIGWSYHLDPSSVFFFEMSTEVGDSTMRLIEDDLDAVGGAFLPGSVWTGWSSELVAELVTVNGTAGPDSLDLAGNAGVLAFGRRGDDVILASDRQDHLAGGRGNDSLFGRGGDDRLDGNSGDDRLHGGRGNDVLVGGEGNDRLAGGAGGDTFIIHAPEAGSSVTILDFDPNSALERIHLDRSWLAGLGDLTGDGRVNRADLARAFAASGDDLVYETANGSTLVLAHSAGTSLTAGDFWLIG